MDYIKKLNIQKTSIGKAKIILKKYFTQMTKKILNGESPIKISIRLIGNAGIGKTDILRQIALELQEELKVEFGFIELKCPVITRDDFLIPYPIGESDQFKMLYSDFVPSKEEFGILVLDEFSRGDTNLQMLLWQAQNECRIHTKSFPRGWFVVSIDNPDDDNYSMNTIDDSAGMRRSLHIGCECSTSEWINYAINSKFHPFVTNFIMNFTDRLYDNQSHHNGQAFANPSSWEKVSEILKLMEIRSTNASEIESIDLLISGLINTGMSSQFIEYVQKNETISPDKIIFNFETIKDAVKVICETDNFSASELTVGLFLTLKNNTPGLTDAQKEGISEFFCMIPRDIFQIFLSEFNKIKAEESFKYIALLMRDLTRFEKFRVEVHERTLNGSDSETDKGKS